MSSQATLRLIDTTSVDLFGEERRRAVRYSMSGQVTSVRRKLNEDEQEDRHRICSMQLLNMSDTGLGMLCDEPVELNSMITVIFPPHGPERGFDLTGRVVRCYESEETEGGHEIGIYLEERPAA